MDTTVFSFDIKEQLLLVLQNVSEVNRERSRLKAASRVYDSTKHNGLITACYFCRRTHEIEKNFACQDCRKTFLLKHELGYHCNQVP